MFADDGADLQRRMEDGVLGVEELVSELQSTLLAYASNSALAVPVCSTKMLSTLMISLGH